jgi:hypothetical protein
MRSFGRPLAVAFLSLALLASSALAHKDGKKDDNDEKDQGGPTPRAPEIDPGFLGSSAALLGGAMLIFRNRRRS